MYPTLQMVRKLSKTYVFGPPVGLEIEGVFFLEFVWGQTDLFTNEHRAVGEDQRCEKVGLNIIRGSQSLKTRKGRFKALRLGFNRTFSSLYVHGAPIMFKPTPKTLVRGG